MGETRMRFGRTRLRRGNGSKRCGMNLVESPHRDSTGTTSNAKPAKTAKNRFQAGLLCALCVLCVHRTRRAVTDSGETRHLSARPALYQEDSREAFRVGARRLFLFCICSRTVDETASTRS